jgi:branched-chain amino acid transport system substrate-binding protein
MRVLHRFAVTAAIGLLALLSAAHRASAEIKIGAVLSVSGPASFLGDPEKKTLEIYVDEINAKGGVNGQKLQLVVYDDAGSADSARTFATRLVEEDKIVAMVGGSTTGATASPIASVRVFETVRDADVVLLRSVRSQRRR